MNVLLHKIKSQKQIVIHLPVKRNIDVAVRKTGFVVLKVPYKATTQNRLLIDLDGKRVEAYVD